MQNPRLLQSAILCFHCEEAVGTSLGRGRVKLLCESMERFGFQTYGAPFPDGTDPCVHKDAVEERESICNE